jgi:hypothetical protein
VDGRVVAYLAEQWGEVVVKEEEGGWYVETQLYCQGCEARVLGTPSIEEMGTAFVTQATEMIEGPLYLGPETSNIHRTTSRKQILTFIACSYIYNVF